LQHYPPSLPQRYGLQCGRGKSGKTTGYYVPQHAAAQIRQGLDAWSQLQNRLRELAALNKERLIPAKPKK
jgi:hypothetical protein